MLLFPPLVTLLVCAQDKASMDPSKHIHGPQVKKLKFYLQRVCVYCRGHYRTLTRGRVLGLLLSIQACTRCFRAVQLDDHYIKSVGLMQLHHRTTT